jgi:hypothetical protein
LDGLSLGACIEAAVQMLPKLNKYYDKLIPIEAVQNNRASEYSNKVMNFVEYFA